MSAGCGVRHGLAAGLGARRKGNVDSARRGARVQAAGHDPAYEGVDGVHAHADVCLAGGEGEQRGKRRGEHNRVVGNRDDSTASLRHAAGNNKAHVSEGIAGRRAVGDRVAADAQDAAGMHEKPSRRHTANKHNRRLGRARDWWGAGTQQRTQRR